MVDANGKLASDPSTLSPTLTGLILASTNADTTPLTATSDYQLHVRNLDTTDDNWAGIAFDAYNGAAYEPAGGIAVVFTDHTASSVNGDLILWTANNSSVAQRAIITSGGYHGINEASPDTTWHVTDNTTPVAIVERTTSGTITTYATLRVKTTSSGDMGDGFGPKFVMAIEDTAGVNNPIAELAAERNGADNTGKLTISPVIAGSATESASFDSTGVVVASGLRLTSDEVRAGFMDVAEQAAPGSPAADYIRIYAVEDADFTVLETVTDLGVVNRINQDTFRVARNTSGGELAKGTVIRYTGSTGNKPNFSAAQANSAATMPGIGILGTAVADNSFGEVMLVGRITGIKTDYTAVGEPTYAPVADWAEGDVLYVNTAVLGGLQNSKPAHPNFSQWIATIETVHANQGIILVKTQAALGLEDGTNSNTFTIGDTGAGTKSLKFDGSADGQIDWTGTAFDFTHMLTTSEVRARDGDGLKLFEDGGTGIHVQDGAVDVTVDSTGVGIGGTPTAALTVIASGNGQMRFEGGTSAAVTLKDTSAGVNEKTYQWRSESGNASLNLINDAYSAYVQSGIIYVDNSGNVIINSGVRTGFGSARGTLDVRGTAAIWSTTPYLTLHNTTHEDTDGGRKSKLIFEGEQSGGELSTLAEIEAHHDGSADDEKGQLVFRVNDGNDGSSPTTLITMEPTGIGIGATPRSPRMLTIGDGGSRARIVLESASYSPSVDFYDDDGRESGSFFMANANDEFITGALTEDMGFRAKGGNFLIGVAATKAGKPSICYKIDTAGNHLYGGATAHANSINNIAIKEGTAPGGAVADQCFLWAQDDSGTAEMYVQDGAGNQLKISGSPIDEWVYLKRNVKTGKEVRIDMMRLIRDVEKLTGEKYVSETHYSVAP